MISKASGVSTIRLGSSPWTTKAPPAIGSRNRDGTVRRFLSSKECWYWPRNICSFRLIKPERRIRPAYHFVPLSPTDELILAHLAYRLQVVIMTIKSYLQICIFGRVILV